MTKITLDEAMILLKRGAPPSPVATLFGSTRQYISAEAQRRGIQVNRDWPPHLERNLLKTLLASLRRAN